MSDIGAIECPPTPERIDQCPATPERINDLKSPNSSIPSDEDQSSSSPPPNCAICLGRCRNKCFTDSCLHQFCFSCLLEWSKIKAECPLCKQAFKSIIHNVKSIDQFEEYLVRQPQPQSLYHRLDFLLSEPPRFRYRATLQVRPSQGEAIQQLFLHHPSASLTERRYNHPYIRRPFGYNTRRLIYERGDYALPLLDITGRRRECSAQFYRENPAQIHRLMPFLNREAVCLIPDSRYVTCFMSQIEEILMTHDITSPEFRRCVSLFFLERTSHFLHELLNFARSPYDLIGYDRNVTYRLESSPEVVSLSSESDTDDMVRMFDPVNANEIQTTSRPGRTDFTIETRSNCSTVIVSGSFNGRSDNSNIERPFAQPSTSTTVDNVGGTSSTNSNINTNSEAVVRDSVIQMSRNIDLSSDTDSDECQFVLERKPPHLRTPELVSLNSDTSDSDVVFIEEVKPQLNNITPDQPQPPSNHSSQQTVPKLRNKTLQSTKSEIIFNEDTETEKRHTDYEIDVKPLATVSGRCKTERTDPSYTVVSSSTTTTNCSVPTISSPSLSNSGNALPSTSAVSSQTRSSTKAPHRKFYAHPIRISSNKRKLEKCIFEDSSTDSDSTISSSTSSTSSSYSSPQSYLSHQFSTTSDTADSSEDEDYKLPCKKRKKRRVHAPTSTVTSTANATTSSTIISAIRNSKRKKSNSSRSLTIKEKKKQKKIRRRKLKKSSKRGDRYFTTIRRSSVVAGSSSQQPQPSVQEQQSQQPIVDNKSLTKSGKPKLRSAVVKKYLCNSASSESSSSSSDSDFIPKSLRYASDSSSQHSSRE